MNWKRPFRHRQAVKILRGISHCPKCADAVTDMYEIGPDAPKPGGFTICPTCHELLRFKDDLKLRILTDDDKKTLDENPETVEALEQLQRSIGIYAAQKPAPGELHT